MASNYQQLAERILPFIREHVVKKICDYGCGEGSLLKCLRAADAEPELTGIDYFGKFYPSLTETHDPALFTAVDRDSDAYTGLLGSQSFDMIVSSYALHHFQYPLRELRQIAGMVRPGGLLVFFDHCVDLATEKGMAKALSSLVSEVLESLAGRYHRHHFTLEEALDLLSVLPVEVITAREFTESVTTEERDARDEWYIERLHSISEKVQEHSSSLIRSIYLPLLTLDEQTVKTYGSDYSRLMQIVAIKK